MCCIGCLVRLRGWRLGLRLGVQLLRLLLLYCGWSRRLLNGLLLRVLVLRYRLVRCLVGWRDC